VAAVTNYRKVVVDRLVPYFRRDPRYFFLAGDMGFGAIDGLRREFPDRILNTGIMEQAAVGIAAGMSMSGLIPIVYTMVNFLAFRSLEQIRNDVVLQGLNVKLLGTGANDYFRFLGPSHCCGRDDVEIMKIIKIPVFDPYGSSAPFDELVDRWIASEEPGYLRV
jgi:transketolase